MDPQLDDQFERQFFSYVLDRIVPASAVQDPNQLQILSDADFEWWWILAARTSSLLKVLMKEAATGRDFIQTTASSVSGVAVFNGINIDLWAGTAAATAAFPLAVPYIMPATRTYSLLFTEQSGAPNTVELVFSGFKLWPRPKG
ncbi:MAG TPA: hypothetical protein VJX23_02935 [Candidatus Binataceae bacterium]|nr:hypothetical protein [Candidatus Binataceae bacterium]